MPSQPEPAPPAGLTVGDAVEIRGIVVLPRRHWGRWAALIAVVAAGAIAAVVYTQRISLHVTRGHHAAPARHVVIRHELTPVVAPKPTTHAHLQPKPTRAQVRVVATSPAWLQIRRGSASGPVLYEGTLTSGSARRFVATQLWIRFGWAGDVAFWANGKRVHGLSGTTAVLVTPRGVKPA